MKYLFSLIFLLASVIAFSQDQDQFKTDRGYAIIQGHIKNNTQKSWSFAQTGYLNNSMINVPIDSNGNFLIRISFDGKVQDIYLYLNNDAITMDAWDKDTISMSWDELNIINSLKINKADKKRDAVLQTELMLYKKYRKPFLSLIQSTFAKIPDSVKLKQVNDLYNQEIQTACDSGVITEKMATDIYYKYTSQLFRCNLLPAYGLYLKDTAGKGNQVALIALVHDKDLYRYESDEAFKTSEEYRDFIFNYLRFSRPINGWPMLNPKEAYKMSPISPAWDDYYTALANLKLYETRDWFITKDIMFDFQYYSFDDAKAIYQDFIPKIKVYAYADSLAAFYKKALVLQPGNMAPDITLKNDSGADVSLKGMRGKIVFVDFWGVGCAPCISDIKNAVPGLHEKYKGKKIVFVNICVDAGEKTWKYNLAALKLTGVNLIAPGWTSNPVCKAYSINGIPRYIIIDANGKIVDSNSPRPSEPDKLYPVLDRLLAN